MGVFKSDGMRIIRKRRDKKKWIESNGTERQNVEITCTWNKVIESSSICTRMANFFDPRPAPDAEPSTPDGVLIEWVIRLPDVDACDGAIFG